MTYGMSSTTMAKQLPDHPNQHNCMPYPTNERSTAKFQGYFVKPRDSSWGRVFGPAPCAETAREILAEDDPEAQKCCPHIAGEGHEIYPCELHEGERPFWVCEFHTYQNREDGAHILSMAPRGPGCQIPYLCDDCFDEVYHYYRGPTCGCPEWLSDLSEKWACVDCVDRELAKWFALSPIPYHDQLLNASNQRRWDHPWQCGRCFRRNPAGVLRGDNLPENICRTMAWFLKLRIGDGDQEHWDTYYSHVGFVRWCEKCQMPCEMPDGRPTGGLIGCACLRCELRWRMERYDELVVDDWEDCDSDEEDEWYG